MKIRKELGSPAVRDLVLEAVARARELPDVSIRDPDPWTSWRQLTPEEPVSEKDEKDDDRGPTRD